MSHPVLVDLERSASALVPVIAEMPEIPGYWITSLLGEGGMGRVYAATSLTTNKQVVVKLTKKVAGAAFSVVSESDFLEALYGVSGFPQLIEPAQELQGKSQWYLVMNRISGERLFESFFRLPMPILLDVFCQVASELKELHLRGIIHGDVKTENIIFGNGPIATLIDFGLSKWEYPQEKSTDFPIGTYAFLAPEMWVPGNLISPAIDVYAFGRMLHEAISGTIPFKKARYSLREYKEFHLNAVPSKLDRDSPISPRLVQAMLHKYPQYRPSMDEVHAELVRVCLRGVTPTLWDKAKAYAFHLLG